MKRELFTFLYHHLYSFERFHTVLLTHMTIHPLIILCQFRIDYFLIGNCDDFGIDSLPQPHSHSWGPHVTCRIYENCNASAPCQSNSHVTSMVLSVSCRMSNVTNTHNMPLIFLLMSLTSISHISILRNDHVAVSNLGVQGHTLFSHCLFTVDPHLQ